MTAREGKDDPGAEGCRGPPGVAGWRADPLTPPQGKQVGQRPKTGLTGGKDAGDL